MGNICCCFPVISKFDREPLSKAHPEMLDKKLEEFYVATSHNTYLPSLQVASISSVKAIENALKMGARCIELDVFSGKNNEPIILHGGENFKNIIDIHLTSSIKFKDAILKIAEKGFEDTDDPLFICIENNTNKNLITNDLMADILSTYVGSKLLTGFKDISQMTIRELLGKIVIITGSGNTGSKFMSLVNSSVYSVWFGNYPSTCEADTITPGGVARVYPDSDARGVISLNYNSDRFFNGNPTFIAMNYQTSDKNLNAYLKRFEKCSIIPK
jgi:hypothetical protein